MSKVIFDQQKIAEILPQSYPMIMIDKVIEFEKDKSLTAVKNVTGDEWFFGGQNTRTTTFPETMLIEAAAQAAIILYKMSKNHSIYLDAKFILNKVNVEFSKVVLIGESINIKSIAKNMFNEKGYMETILKVGLNKIGSVDIYYVVKEGK